MNTVMSNSKPREFWIEPGENGDVCRRAWNSPIMRNEEMMIHVREVTAQDTELRACFDEMLSALKMVKDKTNEDALDVKDFKTRSNLMYRWVSEVIKKAEELNHE